jgi:hypothetical protein
MLSMIVFVMIVGGKFLNKYDLTNKSMIKNSEKSENILNENSIGNVSGNVDEERSEWENSADFRDEGGVKKAMLIQLIKRAKVNQSL